MCVVGSEPFLLSIPSVQVAEEEARKLGGQVKEIVKQMDDTERQLEEQRRLADRYLADRDRLAEELARLAAQMQADLLAAEQRGKELSAKLAKQAEETAAAAHEVRELQGEVAALRRRCAELEQRLAAANEEEAAQREVAGRLERQLKAAGDDASKARSQLTAELQEARRAHKDAQAEAAGLKAELAEARASLDRVNSALEAMNLRLNAKIREWEDACERIKLLKSENLQVCVKVCNARAPLRLVPCVPAPIFLSPYPLYRSPILPGQLQASLVRTFPSHVFHPTLCVFFCCIVFSPTGTSHGHRHITSLTHSLSVCLSTHLHRCALTSRRPSGPMTSFVPA